VISKTLNLDWLTALSSAFEWLRNDADYKIVVFF